MKYHIEQCKDAGDFYAYCDVFDWHFIRVRMWRCGVALVGLERGLAIFNGHNNKAYFFEDDVPGEWVATQFNRCVEKYHCDFATACQIQQKAEEQWEAIIAEKRRLDY